MFIRGRGLDAEVGGDREELLEIIVDPVALESYNLSYTDLVNYVARNNRLVAPACWKILYPSGSCQRRVWHYRGYDRTFEYLL